MGAVKFLDNYIPVIYAGRVDCQLTRWINFKLDRVSSPDAIKKSAFAEEDLSLYPRGRQASRAPEYAKDRNPGRTRNRTSICLQVTLTGHILGRKKMSKHGS